MCCGARLGQQFSNGLPARHNVAPASNLPLPPDSAERFELLPRILENFPARVLVLFQRQKHTFLSTARSVIVDTMADNESPTGSPAREDPPVDDGQEKEFVDEVAAADSDKDSDLLSEVDEDQFEDYDPETANIEDRPVDIDEDVARTLKVSKRKRIEGQPKKPREGRREKKRRDRDEDVAMEEGSDGDQERKPRRRRAATESERAPRAARTKASPETENEENLTPEERRKRAIDRALDAAIKKGGSNTTRRRKKDEIVCNMRSRPRKGG